MRRYKLALIGFGGVNRALAQLIQEKRPHLIERHGLDLSVTAVSDIYYGFAQAPDGLDLQLLGSLPAERGALARLPGGAAEANNERAIRGGADIIAEATFTNAKTAEPAISHCRLALSLGKHVVTTNKGPIALYADELYDLAQQNSVSLECEGAVMSGTPVLRLVSDALPGVEIKGFRGLLNGTCNYILGRMEAGAGLADAIAEAQALGYAEADPTADVEGFDVMLKVQILANRLMKTNLAPSDIIREGIAKITEDQMQWAASRKSRWKLVGQAVRNDRGGIDASVTPQCLTENDPLASVHGAMNALVIDTDVLGPVVILGPGAGRTETAYALLSDIIAIHRNAPIGSEQCISAVSTF